MTTPAFLKSLQEPVRNEIVLVGVSSVVVSQARQGGERRKSITIRNNSPNAIDIITLNFGQQNAVANTGITLRQYESVTDASDRDEDDPQSHGYSTFQGVITAICATANGSLSVMER